MNIFSVILLIALGAFIVTFIASSVIEFVKRRKSKKEGKESVGKRTNSDD